MAERVLLDPAMPPDDAAVERALGDAWPRWNSLERRTEALGALGAWSWGGRKYGWEKRHKRSGRPFVTLTPLDRAFSALVVLGRAEVELALALPLHERARALLETTPQLHDGRWLFLQVEDDDDVKDVTALLVAKLPPSVRARALEPSA